MRTPFLLCVALFLAPSALAQGRQADIWVMERDGSGARPVVAHPASDEEPEWSPDGAQIAFDSSRNGNNDIFVVDASGADLKQLTNSPAKEDHAAWSPDGSRIAYQHEWEGNTDVYVMDSDGSNQRRLTDHAARGLLCDHLWSQGSGRDNRGELLRGADGSQTPRWVRFYA